MKRTNSKLLAATFSLAISCSAFATGGKNEPPQKKTTGDDLKIEIIIADIKAWFKTK